jgi:hypothetical protein
LASSLKKYWAHLSVEKTYKLFCQLFFFISLINHNLIAQTNIISERSLNFPKINHGIDQIKVLSSVQTKTNKITGNSDKMTGTVAVAVFFVESNGSIDPDTYTWTRTDEDFILSQISIALNWWSTKATVYSKNVNFTIVSYRGNDVRCQQGYEPILHNWTYKGNWINQILANFGYSSGSTITRVNNFNTDLKATCGTNWSFSVFVCYNPSPASTTFLDGYSITDVQGGPYIHMLYRNDGWAIENDGDLVAHSVGHIFGALDEYGNCNKSDVSNSIVNANCEKNTDGSVNTFSVDCVMKSKLLSSGVCTYTAAHVGWISSPFTHTIKTDPVGLQVITTKTGQTGTQINVSSDSQPVSLAWEPGIHVNINTLTPQTIASINYIFLNWNDGGSISHDIITHSSSCIFTANFLGPPDPPTLNIPGNDEIEISVNPVPKWNVSNGATSYNLQISADQSFLTLILNQSNIIDTTYPVNGLLNYTKYYWRVSASNLVGTSEWSNTRNFTTKVATPGQVTPLNGSSGVMITPLLSWNAVIGASYYRLQVAMDINFSNLQLDQNNINSTSYSLPVLVKNMTYYWRVKTYSVKGTSDWSEVWSFKTVSTTATINLSTDFLSFDSIGYLTSNVDSTILITNNSSNDNLLITSIYFEENNTTFQVLENPPISLEPNSSKSLTIRFIPDSVGIFSKKLHIINSSNNNADATVTTSGKVLGSTVSLSTTLVNFGNAGINTESRDTVIQIINTGPYILKIFSTNLTLEDSCFEIMSVIPYEGLLLNPNERYNLKVRFKPDMTGLINNSITINNNSFNLPKIIINLSGNVKESNLSISKKFINFDSTSLDNPSKRVSVAFKYAGFSNIKILSAIVVGDTSSFHIVKNCINISLSSGQTDSVIIEFFPITPGLKTALLTIFTDDTLFTNYKINMMGVGTGKSILSASLNKIDFGVASWDTSKDTIIKISNNGNFILDIYEKKIIGRDQSCFSFIYGGDPISLSYLQQDSIKIKMHGSLPKGEKIAQLQLKSNDQDNNIFIIDLGAKLNIPILEKPIDRIVFCDLAVGEIFDTIIVIKNSGNAILIIDSMFIDGPFATDFFLMSSSRSIEVHTDQEILLKIRFHPENTGIRYARLVIKSNDPLYAESSIILRGTGKIINKPIIKISTVNIDFGHVDINSTMELSFTIQNIGTEKLMIDSLYVINTYNPVFSLQGRKVPFEINPSDSEIVIIKFSPSPGDTTKYFLSKIRIICNDPSNSIIDISLSGSIMEQKIQLSDTLINFGNVTILDSTIREISISNLSSNILKIDSIYLENVFEQPFILESFKIPIYIDPYSKYIFKVMFNPKFKKFYSTNLFVKSTYLSEGLNKIKLSGYTISPEMKIPENLTFGKLMVDSSVIQKLIIFNFGDSYLKISSIKILGKDSNEFKLEERIYPLFISIFQKDSINILFLPEKLGIKDAKVKISCNSPSDKDEINIIAEALQKNLSVEPLKMMSYNLSQNYPNPFNPITKIEYSIPENLFVSLKVFDIFGREIDILEYEYQIAGNHFINWLPNNLPSGTYFYKLQAGKYSVVKKLLYLK